MGVPTFNWTIISLSLSALHILQHLLSGEETRAYWSSTGPELASSSHPASFTVRQPTVSAKLLSVHLPTWAAPLSVSRILLFQKGPNIHCNHGKGKQASQKMRIQTQRGGGD